MGIKLTTLTVILALLLAACSLGGSDTATRQPPTPTQPSALRMSPVALATSQPASTPSQPTPAFTATTGPASSTVPPATGTPESMETASPTRAPEQTASAGPTIKSTATESGGTPGSVVDRDSPLAIPPALLEGQGLKFGGESAIEDEDLERVKDVLVLYNVWLPGSLKTRGLVAAVDQRYKVETTTQARQLFKTLEDRFKNQAPPPGDKRTDISGQIQLGDQAFALRSRSPEGNTNYIFIFREETTVAVIVLGYATKADERQAFSIAEGTAKRVEKAVR